MIKKKKKSSSAETFATAEVGSFVAENSPTPEIGVPHLVRVEVCHAPCAQLCGDILVWVQRHVLSFLIHVHIAVHPGYKWVAHQIRVPVVQAPAKNRHMLCGFLLWSCSENL